MPEDVSDSLIITPSYTTSRSSLEFSSVGTPLKLNLFGHYKRLRLWYSLVSCSLDWLWIFWKQPRYCVALISLMIYHHRTPVAFVDFVWWRLNVYLFMQLVSADTEKLFILHLELNFFFFFKILKIEQRNLQLYFFHPELNKKSYKNSLEN